MSDPIEAQRRKLDEQAANGRESGPVAWLKRRAKGAAAIGGGIMLLLLSWVVLGTDGPPPQPTKLPDSEFSEEDQAFLDDPDALERAQEMAEAKAREKREKAAPRPRPGDRRRTRAAPGPFAVPTGFEPRYTWVAGGERDVSHGLARRFVARITVPVGLDRAQLAANVRHALRALDQKHHADVSAVEVYQDGDDTNGGYTVGEGTWAPNGEWGKAERGTSRSRFLVKLELKAGYFQPPAPPSRELRRWRKRGLLGVPLPKGARRTASSPGDPDHGVDPRETYRIKASAAELRAFFERETPSAGWRRSAPLGGDVLMFRKGAKMIGVTLKRGGGGFDLMGS